jgi:hypothetical protein
MVEQELLKGFREGTLSEEEKDTLIQTLTEELAVGRDSERRLSKLKSAVSSLAINAGLWSTPKVSVEDLAQACSDLQIAFNARQAEAPEAINFAMKEGAFTDRRSLKINALLPEQLLTEVDHYIFSLYGTEVTRIEGEIPDMYRLLDRGAGEGPWVYISGATQSHSGGLIDSEEIKELLELAYREMDRSDSPCTPGFLSQLEENLIRMGSYNGGTLESVAYWLLAIQDILARDGANTLCPQVVQVVERIVGAESSFVRHWRVSSDTTETCRKPR